MKRAELLQILSEGHGLQPIKNVNRILRKDESLTEMVLAEALNPNSPEGRNAAWTLEYMCRRKRRTIKPHLGLIIETIPKLTDLRQQGILLHLLIHFKPGMNELSPLLDFLIECLRKVEEVSYLPYYSMQLLRRVLKEEPYFAREFKLAVKEAYPLYSKYYVKRMANLFLADCEKAGSKL